MKTRVMIRWMIACEIPEVAAIQNHGRLSPEIEDDFRKLLRRRESMGVVAEYGGRPVGFALYSLYRRLIEIENLAVHPELRRTGIGRQIIEHLTGKLSRVSRERMLMTVSERNLPAQLFFRACGFRCVAIDHSVFVPDLDDRGEIAGWQDGYVMEFRPPQAPEGLEKAEGMQRESKAAAIKRRLWGE